MEKNSTRPNLTPAAGPTSPPVGAGTLPLSMPAASGVLVPSGVPAPSGVSGAPAAPVTPILVLVKTLLNRTLTHWPLTVVVMLLGALATMQVVRMRKPVYKSETVVFYREGIQRNMLAGPADAAAMGGENLRTLGAKLKETLLAQTNLKKIIDEFHLYPDVVDKSGYTDAVSLFRGKIDFKARSTDTFAISFEGTTKDEAQQVTARLADLLVEENAKFRKERAQETSDFLESEKKRVDDELEKAETDLAHFLAEHPAFAADTNSNRAGVSVRAEQKKVASVEAEKRRRMGIFYRPSRDSGSGSLSPMGPPVDPVLVAARNQALNELISAKKELAEKSLRFTDQHPDVRAAQARVAAAEVTLQQAEQAIAAVMPPPPPPTPASDKSAKPAAGAAPKGVSSSAAGEDKSNARPESALVTLETEWARLNREVNKARQQQTMLEGRLFLAQMAASSELAGYAATIAVLDPAFRPAGPSGKPNRVIVLAGFVGSLVLGIGLAAARGIFLDDRVFDPSELEAMGLCPVLAVVPKPKAAPKPKRRWRRG